MQSCRYLTRSILRLDEGQHAGVPIPKYITSEYCAVQFILTDVAPSWPSMNLTWHDQYTGGHTVNHLPQELMKLYRTQWKYASCCHACVLPTSCGRFPFNHTVGWSAETAWGGEPGFTQDGCIALHKVNLTMSSWPGSNEHVDRDCVYFFAVQVRPCPLMHPLRYC